MNGVANGDAANLALQGLTVQGSSGANSHDNKVVETSSDRLPRGKVIMLNPLPHMLYLEHCIIAINNSNFQIFSKNIFYISIVFHNIKKKTFIFQRHPKGLVWSKN